MSDGPCLNLGSGSTRTLPSPWVNVDIAPGADVQSDVRSLPTEWTGRFEQVRASHVLEHLFLDEVDEAVAEWVRVLAPGGRLLVIVPDLEVIVSALVEGHDTKGRRATASSGTTAVLAQIYGVGYASAATESRWRHRMLYDERMLAEVLARQPELTDVARSIAADDPAAAHGVDDDSQNRFSLAMTARKDAAS